MMRAPFWFVVGLLIPVTAMGLIEVVSRVIERLS